MRWMRIIALCLVATLGLGCFVFNELDSGQKELDQYGSANGHPGAAPAPAPSAPATATSQAKADLSSLTAEWWKKAHTLTSKPLDQDIAPCRIHGHVQFMRKNDCAVRGGAAG